MDESPCRVWWDSEHLVARNDWKTGSVCDLAEATKVISAVSAFGHGPVPVLVDMRTLARADRPAREYFTSAAAQATGVAVIVGWTVSTVAANFIIGRTLMPLPIRRFTDEAAAVIGLAAAAG